MALMAIQPEPSIEGENLNGAGEVEHDLPTSPSDATHEGSLTKNLVPDGGSISKEPHNGEELVGPQNDQTVLVDVTPDTSSLSDSSPLVDQSHMNMITSLDSPLIDQLVDNGWAENSNGNDLIQPMVPTSDVKNHTEHDCLLHPSHLSTMDRLEASKNTIASLQETIERLKEQVARGSEKIEKYDLLELSVSQQQKELELSRLEHEIDLRAIEVLKNETEEKLAAMKKQCEMANKEKENMVMRYAKNEKELLDQKKAKENLENKLKDAVKENEANIAKLKNISASKGKLAETLDSKKAEVSNAYKEIDKLKEEVNSRDIKIKWTQSKLKSEMDEHKNCPGQIEKLSQTVKCMEEELKSLKAENVALQQQLGGSGVSKNSESQLKDVEAKLIMEKHEKAEMEVKYRALQSSHCSLKDENGLLSSQALSLEQERLVMAKSMNKLQEERDELVHKVSVFESELKGMEQLQIQLNEKSARLESLAEEVEKLQKANEDLLSDLATCRSREKEMLSFTQELTVKNVKLLSDFSAVEEKATELEKEEELLEQTSVSLKEEVEKLKAALKDEQTKRHEESRLLARQVAEKTTKALNLESLLTDTQSELNLLRQKHTTALKEMQKELSQYRKRVDQMECNSSASGSDSVTQDSRTSSLSSLNDNTGPTYQVLDVPAHALIDRIAKLQNDCAKQTERIEFLEEHTAHLVKELQKKSKLLQNYIMREQTGALTSKSMDRNKAELAKHGGIMASLYTSKPVESMTLELSMDINRKLQAVLEDTLLKNMTLKENLDTLGDEIARLSQRKT